MEFEDQEGIMSVVDNENNRFIVSKYTKTTYHYVITLDGRRNVENF